MLLVWRGQDWRKILRTFAKILIWITGFWVCVSSAATILVLYSDKYLWQVPALIVICLAYIGLRVLYLAYGDINEG